MCDRTARELARDLRQGTLSANEVMRAHLDRIARHNPTLNAIVARLDDEVCLRLAGEADARRARGETLGPLHGLPIAFKDVEPAVGFPFTSGSPIFKSLMPAEDSVIVERLRRAGVVPIGKTNVPEFGMGSHTYNRVYGTTRNPYDPTKSAGGSSGGAAVALATGMLPIADGSDLGGSLRNPANFNNVVGFRPSVGLVPNAPSVLPFLGFGVKGPMGRTVGDVAFLMSVISGADPRDPGSVPSVPSRFAAPLDADVKGTRIAWCPDLGGLPLDSRVRAVLDARRHTFEQLGCSVEDATPPLDGADEVFMTLRKWRSFITLGPLLAEHRHRMKPEAVWEIEAGAALTSAQVAGAMTRHAALLDRLHDFFSRCRFVACAVNQVPPFDAGLDWPHDIEGRPMTTYVEWMQSAYWISTTFGPAISVPAGFTPEGLPVGIQLAGQRWDDLGVLRLAHAFEGAAGVGARRP
jgi:amidase